MEHHGVDSAREMIGNAALYREKAFNDISEKYGVCERTIYEIARNKMSISRDPEVYHSAIDAAREFGAAGFAYTHIMQTRRLIPEIEATLDGFVNATKNLYGERKVRK